MLVACGNGDDAAGSTISAGAESPTTVTVEAVTTGAVTGSTALPDTTTATGPQGLVIPPNFPVPIFEGGTVVEASPLGAVIIYPESERDALVDYYEAVSQANDGTHFDLFPDGDSWDVQGIQIEVYPVDPQVDPYPPGIALDISLP